MHVKNERITLSQQGEKMNFKEIALECGAFCVDGSGGMYFSDEALTKFGAEVKRQQKAIDASLAYNFPFSPVIGHEIAKIIRTWNEALLENYTQGQTK